jgi:hypothetical protein
MCIVSASVAAGAVAAGLPSMTSAIRAESMYFPGCRRVDIEAPMVVATMVVAIK